MIRREVNERLEAEVPVTIYGPDGFHIDVRAVIDTGYDSWLTLPLIAVEYLGLTRNSTGMAKLADDTVTPFEYYFAEVDWNDNRKTILVSAVGAEVLIGMKLLIGHELRISVVVGGAVTIEPLTHAID